MVWVCDSRGAICRFGGAVLAMRQSFCDIWIGNGGRDGRRLRGAVFTFFVSTNEDPQEYEEYDARISRTLASMERRELEDTILDMLHEYPESYEYFDRYFRNR